MSERSPTRKEGKEVRIVLLGDLGVGKSALTVNFMTGRFLHRYDPTLEDEYKRSVEFEKDTYRVTVVDTAGQNDRRQLFYHLTTADVLMLTFSLSDLSSLESVKDIKSTADCCRDRCVSAVLVGTKKDADYIEVTSDDAQVAARELGCEYVPTSAAFGTGVMDAFKAALRAHKKNTIRRGHSCYSSRFTPGSPEKKRFNSQPLKNIARRCSHFISRRLTILQRPRSASLPAIVVTQH